MLGCFIKLLFITIPLTFATIGVMLILQAARFWLDITGEPETIPVTLTFDNVTPFEAVAFVPSSIRSEFSPLDLEVEIKQTGDLVQTSQEVEVVIADACDYVGIDNNRTVLTFDASSSLTQSTVAELRVRNIRPSPNCPITIHVNSGNATGEFSRKVPVNGWTGQLLAIGKLIGGLLGSGLGLSGILAILFE